MVHVRLNMNLLCDHWAIDGVPINYEGMETTREVRGRRWEEGEREAEGERETGGNGRVQGIL